MEIPPLNFNNIKRINRLLNKMHKNYEYSEIEHPIFENSILRLLRYNFEIATINDMELLYEKTKTSFMIPIAPLKKDGSLPTVEDYMFCFAYIKEQYANYPRLKVPVIEDIPVEFVQFLNFPSYLKIRTSESDFIFDINEQISLLGSKFKDYRTKVNKFKRENEYKIVNIKPSRVDEMMEISKINIDKPVRDFSLARIIVNYKKLSKIIHGLDAFMVVDETEKILGYEIHHKVKYTTTMIGNIKRTIWSIKGLSHFIEHHTAVRMKEKYPELKYINNAASYGGKSAQFKQSMRPIRKQKTVEIAMVKK